jgi:cytochrome c peroxidase
MMNIVVIRWLGALGALITLTTYLFFNFSAPKEPVSDARSETTISIKNISSQLIQPIPKPALSNRERNIAKLGMQIFLDPNVSSNNRVSCESCHHIFDNGAENRQVSLGVQGLGARSSPTVFNVSHNSRFFWDGRASSLETQMDGPVHNPLEMNTNWQKITRYVASVPTYKQQFNTHFNGTINEATIKESLKGFMAALDTPDAPFDLFLRGNEAAMTQAAKNGWLKFKTLGCIACHQGRNIGGNLFQKFGNLNNTSEQESDLGRYNVTGLKSDIGVFRVPSLRNVANTAPYFHDGRADTLEAAIVTMAYVQLGRELEPSTILELKAFLNALSAPPPPVLEELIP